MRYRHASLILLCLALALLVTCATPGTALAKAHCRISVDTILAARGDNVIDPKLRKHVNELQSMFNYTSYRLIGSQTLDLAVGQTGTVALPGDRRLKITPKKIREKRAEIAMQMIKQNRAVFQTQIQLLNRGSLFVGGPQYLNGNLIFKISSSY
ncbi:hypothetical protein [Desulfosarcina ovata]|nr:hypothetical protein [Desulfosarcina ovata]